MPNYHDEIWRQVPSDPDRDRPGSDVRLALLGRLASPGETVLDAGCGDGADLPAIEALGATPVGLDPSGVALERARERGPYELVQAGDRGPWPLADGRFDGVWVAEVLSQIQDTSGVLEGIRRVLRPGGWLGITVPAHGRRDAAALLLRGFESMHHPTDTTVRRYTPTSLTTVLTDHGFTIERLDVTQADGSRILTCHALRP
ncbi:MAG: class I SAM-dependent methyltransferase [Solirubrobacterales bacterium]